MFLITLRMFPLLFSLSRLLFSLPHLAFPFFRSHFSFVHSFLFKKFRDKCEKIWLRTTTTSYNDCNEKNGETQSQKISFNLLAILWAESFRAFSAFYPVSMPHTIASMLHLYMRILFSKVVCHTCNAQKNCHPIDSAFTNFVHNKINKLQKNEFAIFAH